MKNTTSNTFAAKTNSKKTNYLLLSVALAHLLGYGQDSFAVNSLPDFANFNSTDASMTTFVESFTGVASEDRAQFKTDLFAIGHAQLAPIFENTRLRAIVDNAVLGQEAMKKFLIKCASMDKDLMSMMDVLLETSATTPRMAMSQKRHVEKMSKFDRDASSITDQKRASDAARIGLWKGLSASDDKRAAFEDFTKFGAKKMPGVDPTTGVGQVLFTQVTNISDRRELTSKYKQSTFKKKYDLANTNRILEGLTTRADIEAAVDWFAQTGSNTAAAREIENIHTGGFSVWSVKKAAILKLKAVDDFMTAHLIDGGTSTGSVVIDADELRRYLFDQNSLSAFTTEQALVDATATYLSTQLANVPSDLRAAWVGASSSVRDGLLEWCTAHSGDYASLTNYLASDVTSYSGADALAALKMAHAVYNAGTSLASGLSNADKAALIENLIGNGVSVSDLISAKSLVGVSGSDEANLRARIKMAIAVYNNSVFGNLSSGTGADLVAGLVTDSVSVANLNSAKDLIEISKNESHADRVKRIELAISVYNGGASKASSLSLGEYNYDVVNELMELQVDMADLTPANILTAINLVSTTSENAKERALRIAAAVSVNQAGLDVADTGFVGVDFVDALRSGTKLNALQISMISSFADKTGNSGDRATALKALSVNYEAAGGDAVGLISFGADAAGKRALLAGYAGATATVQGYFAAAKADAVHDVLNGLSVWSDIATAITNYNTATSKIAQILGATGGAGDDALVTGAAARTVLANYVVAGTDADDVISFGATVAAKDLLLAGYAGATATVQGYFAAAKADAVHDVLNGLSVWSDIATAITNYNTASASIDVLLGTVAGSDAVTGADARTALANYVSLAAWSSSRSSLLGYMSTAADKRAGLAYFADVTDGAARQAAFDNVSSIVSDAGTWSAIQAIVDHSDIHDALKVVDGSSRTLYADLSGGALSSANKRDIINNLVSLGFTNGDIGAIELASIDASAMVLNVSALDRSTYIALSITGAFDYVSSDSSANRQVLVDANSAGFANLKVIGDLARFDTHPLSAADTATYMGNVLAMETAVTFSGVNAGFDKMINDAVFSHRELIEELLVAGVPVSALKGASNVNIANSYDADSMVMNTSVEQRAMHIALRAISIQVGGDGAFAAGPFDLSDTSSDNLATEKQVVVQAMSDNYFTPAEIYAKKDIFTFASKTAADQANYIVDVMNLDYALEMGGFYNNTIASGALSDANKKAIIAAILADSKDASYIEGLAAESVVDYADQTALINHILGL